MRREEIERISNLFNENGYYESSYEHSLDLGLIDEVIVAFQEDITLPASLLEAYERLFLTYQSFAYMDEATEVMPSVQVRCTQIEEQDWSGKISFTFFFVFDDKQEAEIVRISEILTIAFGLVVAVAPEKIPVGSAGRKRKKRQQRTSKSNNPSNNRQKRKVA